MAKQYNPPPNWPSPPAGWTPPPGWKPDPGWGPPPAGWKIWLDDRSWFARHKILTVVGALVLVGIIGQSLGGNDETPVAPHAASTASTPAGPPAQVSPAQPPTTAAAPSTEATDPTSAPPAPDKTEKADSEYGSQPSDQTKFVAAVTTAQEAAGDADNDMKLGAALSRRNKALCKIVGNGNTEDWSGKISTLDANGDGKGVVSIEIAEDVHVATWNNAFSDYEDNTLIKPGPLFDKFLSHEEDDVVTFSGKLLGDNSCVNDTRLTLSGKVSDPEFLFRFSDVS